MIYLSYSKLKWIACVLGLAHLVARTSATQCLDTVNIKCYTGLNTGDPRSIYFDVHAGPSGAPEGFTVEYMSYKDFEANSFSWYSSGDSRLCSAKFKQNDQINFMLGPNQGMIPDRNGPAWIGANDMNVPTNCPQLQCGSKYVIRAYATGTADRPQSAYSQSIICSTRDCPYGPCEAQLDLTSLGYDDTNAASIWLNGAPVPIAATGEDRGFKCIVLDGTNLLLKGRGSFDTWGDSLAVEAFADFLKDDVAEGDVLACVVKDSGVCPNVGLRFLEVLAHDFAAEQVDYLSNRDSYAIISYKGYYNYVMEDRTPAGQGGVHLTACLYGRSPRPQIPSCGSSNFVTVRSQSYDNGNTASIVIAGVERLTDPERGFNCLHAGPELIDIAQPRNFDTWGDDTASDRFLAWLQGIPDGRVLFCAVKDEGSVQLSSATRDYLATAFGLSEIQHFGFRMSYALIGWKNIADSHPFESLHCNLIAELNACLDAK